MTKPVLILTKLTRFCDLINKTITSMTSVVLFLMLLISIIAIFFRYVLGDALAWTGDILLPAFVWVSLLGISIAARSSSHVIIDSFIKLLRKKVRKRVAVATELIIACFCGFLVIEGIKVALAATKSRWGVLQLPSAYIYMAFPLAFFLIFLYLIDDISNIVWSSGK